MVTEGDVHRLVMCVEGTPQPQGRGRATLTRRGVRVVDPRRSKAWKEAVAWRGRLILGWRAVPAFPRGVAVWVEIDATHPRSGRDRGPGRTWCTKNVGDIDNISKAVLDALNGIWWADDRQVAKLTVRQYVAALDEESHVRVQARVLEEAP